MQDDDAPVRIKLRGFGFGEPSRAQIWVKAMYSNHPANPMNNKQLTFVYNIDSAPVVTLVELRADLSNPRVAWIDWIQSTPRKTGAAARTIRAIQQSAAESGISLRLTASSQSDVPEDALEQIYAKLGFVKDNKGMLWTPELSETWSKKYKQTIDCNNPKGFSQRAHCAARRKRQAGGKTASKSVNESWLSAAQALEDYANATISHEHPAFGDFMYHAELIRKGHQDIHRKDLPKVARDYKNTLVDIVNKHTVIEESDELGSRGEFSTVFRNRSNEQGGHRVETSADEFVDHIDKLLASSHSNDQAVVELATVYERQPHKIKNWPELVAVLNTHKDAVIKIIRYHYTKELYYHAMTRSAMVSAALIAAGVSWPELPLMLEENKHKIIKGLLQLVKDDADDYATKQIQALWHIHINWPELAVIDKSITIEKKSLNEAVSHYSKKELDHISKMALERNDPEYAWGYLHTIGVPAVDVPDVKEFLDKNKRHFIENLLKLIKLGDAYSISVVKYKTSQLKNQGFDWPELVIIEKSISKNITESRTLSAKDFSDVPDQRWRSAATIGTQLINKMHMGYHYAILSALGDLRTYGIDNNETIRAVFNAVKPELVNYVNHLLKTALDTQSTNRISGDSLVAALSAVFQVKLSGTEFAELDNLILSNKEPIIRTILNNLKNSTSHSITHDIVSALSVLDSLGYDWPEIEIIRKSMKKSYKGFFESDLDQIYKDIDTENTKLNISQQMGVAKLRDLLSRGKLANGSMAAFMIHLQYLNLNDTQKAKVYPQIERDFAAFITRRIKKKEINVVLDVFGGLVLNDIDCPNVVAVINKHKSAVLKNLLAGIRTHYKQVSKLVKEIVNKHILDWPELDIIMKSINSPQLKEAELLDKPTPTVEELATKHNCTPQDVLIELRKGVAIEKEHTNRLELAREIALDHLNEDLYYYVKLKKVENK